jgi:MFS transporter, UMF1 family
MSQAETRTGVWPSLTPTPGARFPPPMANFPSGHGSSPWLERLGLHRPELRAWAFYDWANSAMVTTILAAVFPVYYYKVAGAHLPPGVATQRYALCTTAALAGIALLGPALGTLADVTAAKKKFLGGFMGLGVVAVAAMYWIEAGDLGLASALLILANLGASGSFVFYDSLLPHVARPQEMDRVSTAGYALGYLGGGLLLALNIAWITFPGAFGLPSGDHLSPTERTLPTRLAFLSVAIWWAGFSIPLLRRVPEPRVQAAALRPAGRGAIAETGRRLRTTFRDLRAFRPAFLMLLAFLLYNDGISTIIKMASIYGTEIGIDTRSLLVSILLVQFIGIPCSLLFGQVAARVGTKRTLYAALAIYIGIAMLAAFMRTAAHFFALAVAVGFVQGGAQALSRSLFASLIPRQRSSEFFGFFAVLEKFAGVLGPAFFVLASRLTGSSRNAIVCVVLFFVAGALLLRAVDVDAGRQAARAAE